MTKLVKNGQAWVEGEFRRVNLLIDAQGKITGFEGPTATPVRDYERVFDADNCLVFPGGIDAHAHIQDGVETFYPGSCAAAVGGITTVIDMPPFHVCSTPAGLKERMVLAGEACVVDFSTHGGIVVELADLTEMAGVASAGAAGFKVFMPAQPPVSRDVLWGAVQTAARTGLRLVIHAEEPACLLTEVNWADPLGFAAARPPVAETAATAFILEMAQAAGAPVHICHVSAGRTAELIDNYRSQGVDVTAETTPHFLLFQKEDFHRLGARLKTTPPLREARDNDLLWQALAEGVIDMVVSDHFLGELPKKGADVSFKDKGAGIAGLEVSLPLLYHTAVVEKRLTVERFIQVIAENPARVFGFTGRKGTIALGYDADLVIFDPEEEWIVQNVGDFSRADSLPYEGWRLQGKIKSTLVRGTEVWNGETIQVEKGAGEFIAR